MNFNSVSRIKQFISYLEGSFYPKLPREKIHTGSGLFIDEQELYFANSYIKLLKSSEEKLNIKYDPKNIFIVISPDFLEMNRRAEFNNCQLYLNIFNLEELKPKIKELLHSLHDKINLIISGLSAIPSSKELSLSLDRQIYSYEHWTVLVELYAWLKKVSEEYQVAILLIEYEDLLYDKKSAQLERFFHTL